MGNEVLIENDLTRYGLRTVHAARMGARPEREPWLEMVPLEVDEDDLTVIEQREDGLDVWHLRVLWHAREVVRLTPNLTPSPFPEGKGSKLAVMWWLGPQPVRLGVDCAASLFREKVGRWPGQAVMRKLPKGVEEGRVIEITNLTPTPFPEPSDEGAPLGKGIRIHAAAWAPVGFVVVGDEMEVDDGRA